MKERVPEIPRSSDTGILTFVHLPWEHYWMTDHHTMFRLARYYKILWVTPPLHWREALRPVSSNRPRRGLKKISPSFWTYSPERYLSQIHKFTTMAQLFEELRIRRIKSLLGAMDVRQLILYIFNPRFASFVGRFNEDLVCYHAYDEYTFSEIDLPITEEESELIRKSDVVFMHSKTLLGKKGHLNSETYYVPNGVAFDDYRKIAEQGKPNLEEFTSIPRPIIGYTGYIKQQIDLKLLLGIARKRKDWSLVLVGPIQESHHKIQKDIESLKAEKNVYFLGGKRAQELPYYIMDMDVCLMCYRRTAYTNYIYPMKLHEYLACGKPVVATRLQNLIEFEDVLSFAEGLEEWIEKIERCLNDSDSKNELKRIAVAKQNSWDSRIEQIKSIFDQKLE